MIDGDRVYPVDKLILHHSAGPEFINASDKEVIDWFSSIGFSRGYQNGAIYPYHTKPGSSELSYAMAQFALHKYTADGNKYGWRWVDLISDVWDNVCWHAGNWPVNQSSVGIEVCGNYLNQYLDDKALMLIADMLRWKDKELGGTLKIFGHKEVSLAGTACPGLIADQIDKLVDMINDPVKWNNILWPAPKEEPVDNRPEWEKNAKVIPTVTMFTVREGVPLIDLVTGGVIKSYPFDQDFSISGETTVGGKRYLISTYSVQKNIGNGILATDLSATDPKPVEPPVVDPEEPPTTPETPVDPPKEEDPVNPPEDEVTPPVEPPKAFNVWEWLAEQITKFFKWLVSRKG